MKRTLLLLLPLAVLLAVPVVVARAGDPRTDQGARTVCVNACPTPTPSPTPVCLRTLPPEGPRYEIRVEYRDGGLEGKPYIHPGGQFGTIDEVNCYLNNHTSQKGVYVVLPAEDERCAPGLAPCLWMIPPGEIKDAYGVRVQ